MKNTGRTILHLNALYGTLCLPVRRAGPHRQADMAPHAVLGPTVPAGEFHEATPYKLDIVHSYPVTAPNPDARRADFFATLSVVSKKEVV